jgi:exodeoxyribonuclease V beta subunit
VEFERAAGPAAHALVAALLAEHGVDRAWAGVLQRMLVDVLTTPLDADRRLSLGRIGARQRIAELEFLFPVAGRAVTLAPGVVPPAGFMKGYIDLVFTFEDRWYVVDWKSNWLGDDYADYAPDRLDAAMRAAQYDLQYRLYALAVHRHLAARLPGYAYDTHFGGVYYLFVRGMRPANAAATGVFFARPERAEIEQLSACFADEAVRR